MFDKYANKPWQANLNYLLSELSEKVRNLYCLSMPVILFIDPSSACQLSCPFCPRGNKMTSRPSRLLDMESFSNMINRFGIYCMQAHLNEIGEPLMNSNIDKIVSRLTSLNISSMISSNLNTKMSTDTVDNLLLAGLDVINGSIDGASQETYEKYRVGGSFQLAIDNLGLIAERNRSLNTGTHVYWQFLVFKHNQHEVDKARDIANSMGILITFLPPSVPEDRKDEWESTLQGFGRTNTDSLPDAPIVNGDTYCNVGEKSICPWPWRGLTLQSTGDVSLCCLQFPHKFDIGTSDMSVADLWNGKYNLAARSYVNGYRILDTKLPCSGCEMRNSSSCHPPRHISEQAIITSGIIPDRLLMMYRELSEIINNGGNYIKLFEELYMHVLTV